MTLIRPAALSLTLFLTLAAATQAEVVRTFRESLQLETRDRIHVDLPVGKLRVEGVPGNTATFEVEVTCKRSSRRCEDYASDLDIRLDRRSTRVLLEVDDWPKWSTGGLDVRVLLRVPRNIALSADLGVGDIHTEGLESNLSLDLGVGDITITGNSASVRSVDVDSGIGKALLKVAGETFSERSFLGGETSWHEGRGEARIEVDLGVGAIEVDLL